jgi:hypothetical protein
MAKVVTGDAKREFTAPFSSHAVLYLRKTT